MEALRWNGYYATASKEELLEEIGAHKTMLSRRLRRGNAWAGLGSNRPRLEALQLEV